MSPVGPVSPGWPFRHRQRIRYIECDMQRVVYNSHYMTYCDEVISAWLASVYGWTGTADDHFDFMLVKAVIDWRGSATWGDVLDIDVGVERWGTTSFALRYHGTVAGRPVIDAVISYVCVRPGTAEKIPVPDDLKAGLGMAPEAEPSR